MNSPKLNILVSYVYWSDKIEELLLQNQDKVRFLLDSGAFTAWKQKKTITVDQYMRFLDDLKIEPWRYFTLDVIGDAKKTDEQYKEMLKCGFKPIPIFTRGEDFGKINELYETSDLVALGGLVGTPKNKGYVKRCMREIGDRKVHWLGFTNQDFLAYYKPYSCDSSSWENTVRYGNLDFYIGKGQWFKINRKYFINNPPLKVKRLIELYGELYQKIGLKEEWSHSGVYEKNIIDRIPPKSWVLNSIDIEKVFQSKFFLSASTIGDMRGLTLAYNFWQKKGMFKNEKGIGILWRP